MNNLRPMGYDIGSEEYRFEDCPHLPGSSGTTAFVCTHHMVIFGTDSGQIHFHKVIESTAGTGESSCTTSTRQSGVKQQPLEVTDPTVIKYPYIDRELIKAVAIAPAGVASSSVKAMAISPCHSRLACVTLDGTLHLLQLYYQVAVIEDATDGGSTHSGSGLFRSSSSPTSRAPMMLDVRRIGVPIPLSSQVVTLPIGSPVDPEQELSASAVLVTGTPRMKPTTRRLVLSPAASSACIAWTDCRTVLVGCAKHASVLAVVLSRPPFLGNVWISRQGPPNTISEKERADRIIATDCSMPVASKVLLLTYDPLDASELLQIQFASVESVGADPSTQVLAVTTEARSTLAQLPEVSEVATEGVPETCTLFTADSLLQMAFNDPTKASVVMEIDPPLKPEDDVQKFLAKASNLWKGIVNDIANADTSPSAVAARTNSSLALGRKYAPLFELAQIGQKPREDGYFGATIASTLMNSLGTATLSAQGRFDIGPMPEESDNPNGSMLLRLPFLTSPDHSLAMKVYAARHNQRVFESDAKGTVLRTLRYEPRESETNPYASMEDVPLGLLAGLPAGFESATCTKITRNEVGNAEDAEGDEAQCFLWSEAPTFAAVVKLSDTAGCSCCWALITEDPPEEGSGEEPSPLCFDILSSCAYRHNQFRFVLCSNNKVLMVPIVPNLQGAFDVFYVMLKPAAREAPTSPRVSDWAALAVSPRSEIRTTAPTSAAVSPAPSGLLSVTDDVAEDETGKKKKKKVVVVKKVVKKKGAAQAGDQGQIGQQLDLKLDDVDTLTEPVAIDEGQSAYTSYASPPMEGSTVEPSADQSIAAPISISRPQTPTHSHAEVPLDIEQDQEEVPIITDIESQKTPDTLHEDGAESRTAAQPIEERLQITDDETTTDVAAAAEVSVVEAFVSPLAIVASPEPIVEVLVEQPNLLVADTKPIEVPALSESATSSVEEAPAGEEASPDPVLRDFGTPFKAEGSISVPEADVTTIPWPCGSVATRLYDITDKIFRSYAANSLDNNYHGPLLTKVARKLLPLFEYITAAYVSPATQRGYVRDELRTQTTPNPDTGLPECWIRQYVEEQDALRLFGLPTSHVYVSVPRANVDGTGVDSMQHGTLSTALTGSGGGSKRGASSGGGSGGFGHEADLHSLHQSRFDSSLFNEWIAALLSASTQWAFQTDIEEDATDAVDSNDFWRFDFTRDHNRGGYGLDCDADPTALPEWEAQWYSSSMEGYAPFHYLLDPSICLTSGSHNTNSSPSPSVPSTPSAAATRFVSSPHSNQRTAPTAFIKGTSRTATVLEHQALTKALLGRSRVVLALRLLRAARVSSTFAGTNLAKELERLQLRSTLPASDPQGKACGFVSESEEHHAGRRRIETKMLNAILVCLRTGASDLLEASSSAFPSIVGCGLLEPAGRKSLERSDEFLGRMLIAAGLRLDADEEALTFSTSSRVNREVLAAAANLGRDAERVPDEAIGLFVPVNASSRNDGFAGTAIPMPLTRGVQANGDADNDDTSKLGGGKGRNTLHPPSAGARTIGAAMARLELLLRPMRMDLIQREALVMEELSIQMAAEMDVLRHLLVCGVLDEIEEDDIGLDFDSTTSTLALPREEVSAYLSNAASWCYQHWAAQCRRADRYFRALCDPLLSALDAPRSTSAGLLPHTSANSPTSPGPILFSAMGPSALFAAKWGSEVLAALSRHLDALYTNPPFPLMSSNFELTEWFESQERLCAEELKSAAASTADVTQSANKFASRRFQLVTHPVALALLNRDATAVMELLSIASGAAEPEHAASAQYMRDWNFSASRPRNSVSANELSHHHHPQSAFEAHRKDALAAFHHPAVPQLLHYLPYLSVVFPSKLMPLILEAFPAISARTLYPATSSRNRRLRPSNAVHMTNNSDVGTDGTRSTIHNDAAESETHRIPLGGSPLHYDAHQSAASVLNFWLLKAEHEVEVAGKAAKSTTKDGAAATTGGSDRPNNGSVTARFNRSNRSVSRRRDTTSLLKLITSTANFECQSRQDLLDDLCQCVLVVAQQKGSRVMELLTASSQQQAHSAGHGKRAFNETSFGGSNGITSSSPSSTSANGAIAFNKSFQSTVRAASAAINADTTSEAVAVKETMRVVESSLRFLISFGSTKSYWAVGAATRWSPLTVLSAALERRKRLLEELGDERETLDSLLGGDTFGPSLAGELDNDSFASGGNPRSSMASITDMGNFGSKHNTSPSFFGGLLRKSSMKIQSLRRKEASHQVAIEQDRAHVDPIYANIGAFAAAKRAQNSKDPAVQQHYTQLLQTQRKIVRVEDSIMVFLSSASLSLADSYHAQFAASIANNFGSSSTPAPVEQHQSPVEVLVSRAFYPEVLRLLDVYVFPRAVLDLDLVNCFIEDHAKRRAVADLLPLFQTDSGFAADAGAAGTVPGVSPSRTPNVGLFSVAGTSTCKLTEQHWIALLTHSQENGCLEAAMVITMSVFGQQPKKARYLLRRAFPLLDFPDQLAPEVKRVAAKFAPILGLKV